MEVKTKWDDVQLPIFGKKDLEEMTYHRAEELLMSKVYEVTLLFEQLEDVGKVYGNGKQMRQKAGYAIKKILKEHWKRSLGE